MKIEILKEFHHRPERASACCFVSVYLVSAAIVAALICILFFP